MKDDNELWLELIKRDIPNWEEYDLPEKSECWYELYCDLREQVQKSVDEDAKKMKMALDGIKSERAKHSAKFVTDRRSVRLPRERPTAKQRYASYDRKMGGIAPVFATPKSGLSTADPIGAPAWSFERPQMPRSEAMGAPRKRKNIFTAPKRNSVLTVPTKQLNTRATQIRQAPRSLIEEHRRPSEQVVARPRPPTLATPEIPKPSSTPTNNERSTVASPSLREREARLRALTSGSPAGSRTPNPSEKLRPSSTTPVTSHSSARTVSRNASTMSNEPVGPQPTKATSRPDSQSPNNRVSQPTRNTDVGENKESSEQSPRPAIVRKRPGPSVFMMPKRRRVT